MSDFLSSMAASSRLRADGVRSRSGVTGLSSMVSSARPPIPLVLDGFDVIAEVKLASPSEGRLAPAAFDREDVVTRSAALRSAGAAALSILTEPDRFDGSIDDLRSVAGAVDAPVMRKDFLVDPIQVSEARAAGASGVLLIAKILESGLLVEMTDLALSLGLFVLVEVFDRDDLDVAGIVFDRDVLIGVNARNLRTLDVEPDSHASMASLLPSTLPLVAESGIETPEDGARAASLGYDLALVGTALTRAANPTGLLEEMLAKGRAA